MTKNYFNELSGIDYRVATPLEINDTLQKSLCKDLHLLEDFNLPKSTFRGGFFKKKLPHEYLSGTKLFS